MTTRTFSILKPDAVANHHTGEIITRIENKGFRIVALKMLQFTTIDVAKFYSIHKDRPFFRNLNLFMTAGPVIVMVLEKENAVKDFRQFIGETDPQTAGEDTIRHLFGESKTRNAIHASDSEENARQEISFFFSEREITDKPYLLPISEKEIDA